MPSVINPFAGHEVGFTWAQHVAAGLTGGTDYKVVAGEPVIAAMSGTARALGPLQLNAVSIISPSGLVVTVRELKSQTGKFPRTVTQGEQIGVTGLFRDGKTRWPHIDANRPADGKRVPFEQYIGTTAALSSSSLDDTPQAPTRKKPMTFNVVKQSTLDASGANIAGKSLYATLGEVTGPIQYTRTAANDPAPLFNTLYGAHTPLSDATWDFFIAAYTPKVSAAGGAVDNSAEIIAAIAALGKSIPTKGTFEIS